MKGNYTVANSHALALPPWVPAGAVVHAIRELPRPAAEAEGWGDVFARLTQA